MKLMTNIKNNAPSILSIVGVAGLVGTTVMAVKESRKIDDLIIDYEIEHNRDCTHLERTLLMAKGYKFTLLFGTTTTMCILGANVINKRRMEQMSGAYLCLAETFHKYRSRVEELYGKEVDENIMETVKSRLIVDNETGMSYVLDKKELFYDPYNDHYFQATLSEFKRAKYEINKKYAIDGSLNMNDFYAELGLPKVDAGHLLGWCDALDREIYGYTWLELDAEMKVIPRADTISYLEDDESVETEIPEMAYVISFDKTPSTNYMYE